MQNEDLSNVEWRHTVDTIADLAWADLEHGRQHVSDALGSIAMIKSQDSEND